MFYPRVRPPFASRPPSADSALCCEQIATRERTSTHPVQNSPNTPPPAAHPVQNSPNTPKKAHFSQFCTSRENFIPHPPPRPPAGRTLYRAQCQTRYKTLQTRPHQQPNRYKTLPAPRSTAVPRKSSPGTPHTTTEPRRNSPSTPKNGVFRLFRACRANFFALTPTPGRAGRTYSRRGLDRTL